MIRSAVVGRTAAPRRRRPWRALLAPLVLLLATCGPAADTEIRFARSAPPRAIAEASAPAHFTNSEFIADDGARLPLRKWLPSDRVKAVILALHGFGDYSNAFAMPAQIFASRGIATYAFDQRGFGGAPGRGLWAGEERLAADAVTATRLLRLIHPGRPLYLLGESMGGAVTIIATTGIATTGIATTGIATTGIATTGIATTGAINGALAGPAGVPVAEPDGVILSAPAVWGRATMDLLPRLALFAAVRLFPDMVVSGSGLRIRASDNLPMLKALGQDPMVFKGARLDMVYGLADLMDEALAAAPRLAAPTLLLYGAHDQVIPRPPIAEFVAHLPSDPGHIRRLAYYAEGYHLLLRDLQAAAVAGDVASWILDRAAQLPSRADAAETSQPWPPPPDGDS